MHSLSFERRELKITSNQSKSICQNLKGSFQIIVNKKLERNLRRKAASAGPKCNIGCTLYKELKCLGNSPQNLKFDMRLRMWNLALKFCSFIWLHSATSPWCKKCLEYSADRVGLWVVGGIHWQGSNLVAMKLAIGENGKQTMGTPKYVEKW